MRTLIFLSLLASHFFSKAQTSNQRFYPRPQPTSFLPNYDNSWMKDPVKTADNGYVFSCMPFIWDIHNYYSWDTILLKTDSNFVPQWKKPFYGEAIPLPTGGIVLIYNAQTLYSAGLVRTYIEKVTASGTQVFQKEFTGENIVVNDGILTGSMMRLVGRKRGNTGFPSYSETSQPFAMEMDTNGVMTSQNLYTSSPSSIFLDFTKIKRDASGNYFCFSPEIGYDSKLILAKFNASFTPLWASCVTSTATIFRIEDIDILPSGNIFATVRYHDPPRYTALVLFNSSGNIIAQKAIAGNDRISGLCKKKNGHYIVSIVKGSFSAFGNDSIVSFEVDTAMNITWNRYMGPGIKAGTSLIKNNLIYTLKMQDSHQVLFSSDTNGVNCSSYPIPYSSVTNSVQIGSLTLTPVSASATVVNSTLNVINSQPYFDSCACVPSITSPLKLCFGAAANLSVVGTGNLSWYSAKSGGNFLKSGATYSFTPPAVGIYTVFAQDSSCIVPNRIPVTVTVVPVPTVNVLTSNSNLCQGQSATFTLSGAGSMSVNGTLSPINTVSNSSTITVNPTSSAVYTITGSNAPSCNNTQTVMVTVTAFPTITINYSNQFPCSGQSTTLSLSGAQTYSWSNGSTASSTVFNLPSGLFTYTITGLNGVCTKSTVAFIVVQQSPLISVSASPSLLCGPGQATLTASGGSNYIWNTQATSPVVTVNPVSTTIYTVVGGSTSNSCTATKTIQITVASLPSITVNSGTVCSGNLFVINPSGAGSYSFSTGSSSFSPTANTSFTVYGSNQGCTGQAVGVASVSPLPVLVITPNTATICSGQQVKLNASGAQTYSWSHNNIQTNSVMVSPVTSSLYVVTGISQEGCVSTGSVQVTVQLCTSIEKEGEVCRYELFPNPAYEQIKISGCKGLTTCVFFNTSGQPVKELLFESEDYTTDISDLSPGLYFVRVTSPGFYSLHKLIKH